MRSPQILLSGGFAGLLSACAALPPVGSGPGSLGPNDCALQAINFDDAYRAKAKVEGHRWSRILAVHYGKDNAIQGHAICVFIYRDRLMAYDSLNGTRILTSKTALKADPLAVAELWDPTVAIVSARYW